MEEPPFIGRVEGSNDESVYLGHVLAVRHHEHPRGRLAVEGGQVTLDPADTGRGEYR